MSHVPGAMDPGQINALASFSTGCDTREHRQKKIKNKHHVTQYILSRIFTVVNSVKCSNFQTHIP